MKTKSNPAKLSGRTFYRTVFRYEVLSEEPIGDVSLSDIQKLCDSGPCCGRFLAQNQTKLNGKAMADALYETGSEPGFFYLTDTGEDKDNEI